jgi:hypothetical protein
LAGRPRLLLLDANAVFAAFGHGAWEGLCAAYEIVVPATVVRTEAIFYVSRETGRRVGLDLAGEAAAGRIVEVTASPAEIAAVLSRFDASFRKRLDDGEAEAIALLVARDENMRFVSADASAIEAVAMLGMAERAVCLADALRMCGLERRLPRQHGPEFLREHIQEGLRRFVTGEGLA